MSEYWALNDDGRLYIPNLTPESIVYDLTDRNYGSFYLNSEYRIDADAMPDPIQSSSPFPIGVWTMQSDYKLHAIGMPERIYGQTPYPYGVWYLKSIGKAHAGGIPEKLEMEPPYLPSIWHVENDELTLGAYPDFEILGAFANANDLNLMIMSNNLQSIGELSFRNTSLEEVEIPTGCTYSETSFPDGCDVKSLTN